MCRGFVLAAADPIKPKGQKKYLKDFSLIVKTLLDRNSHEDTTSVLSLGYRTNALVKILIHSD